MSEPRRFTDADIDALVAQHLTSAGAPVDVARNLKAIQRRLVVADALDGQPITKKYTARIWMSAAAAVLLVGVGLIGYFATSVQASSAAGLLKEVHGRLVDMNRCYEVETSVPRGVAQRYPFLSPGRSIQVWTHGDEFRAQIEHDGKQILWGRDLQGTIWVTDGQRGLYFARDEVPQPLRRLSLVLSLNEKQLTNNFLRGFEMSFDKGQEPDSQLRTIHAVAKPGSDRTGINDAWIEIDKRTHNLERLELRQRLDGRVYANVVFTLIETSTSTGPSYSLVSNIGPGATILDRQHAEERSELLVELLGPGMRK
jgi:hypothetical protein